MKCGNLLTIIIILFATAGTEAVHAQTGAQSSQRLSAFLYSDFYYIAQNHNEDLKGENGFWTRRVYFTYDNRLNERFTARFRLEMNSPGDFSTNTKLEPYVKDLYLNWAMSENHTLVAGLSPTPTWGLAESIWGYRSVEKSPVDLYKLGSSRDSGIALRGSFGNLNYHAMFGNGSGTGAETNKYKKYMMSLAWWFTDNLVVEVYGEYDKRSSTHDRTTVHALAGYVSDNFNIGAMYASQSRNQQVTGASDLTETLDVASVFTNFKLADKWTGILRADHMFDANPQGPTIDYIPFSSEAESTLLIIGLGYQPIPRIHVIPNIETIFYGDAPDGSSPKTDVILRTTLYFTF